MSSIRKNITALTLPIVALLALTIPANLLAQGPPVRIAVLDVQRILVESATGKAALADLKTLQDQSVEQAKSRQDEIETLRQRIADGRLSLSADRLTEMDKELEEKVRQFRRFQEDVEREMGRKRDQAFEKIERDVMPIIEKLGAEGRYTLVFNKFQSGLVYADEQIDITDQVIELYNQATSK